MSSISDFSAKQIVTAVVQKNQNLLSVKVPLQLTERRIYLYTEVLQSASAAFRMKASVIPRVSGIPMGRGLPADLGDLTAATEGDDFSSLFNGGGSPVGDSLVLRFIVPFVAGVNSVVLQPFRFNAAIDELIFSIDEFTGTNITNFRAYLAVISTKY